MWDLYTATFMLDLGCKNFGEIINNELTKQCEIMENFEDGTKVPIVKQLFRRKKQQQDQQNQTPTPVVVVVVMVVRGWWW